MPLPAYVPPPPPPRRRRRKFTPDEILTALADGPWDKLHRISFGQPLTTGDLARLVRLHHGEDQWGDGTGNADVLPALTTMAKDGRLITSRYAWSRRGAAMPTDEPHRYLTDGFAVNANERVWATPASAEAWKAERDALEAQRKEAHSLARDLGLSLLAAGWAGDDVQARRNGTRVEFILSTTAAAWLRDTLNARRTETP